MARRLQAPAVVRLKDPDAERVRRDVGERIRELQSAPIVGGKSIKDIALPDGVTVNVSHGLGRKAVFHLSPPRASGSATVGMIRDVTAVTVAANQADVRDQFCLKADGYGETVYVDAWVY